VKVCHRKPLTDEQKAARKAYKRQWYLANRERTLAVNQAYRENNPELIKRLKKEWGEENKDKVRAWHAAYRKTSEWKEYQSQYVQKHPRKEYRRKYYMTNRERLIKEAWEWQKANRGQRNTGLRELHLKKWLKRAGWTYEEFLRREVLGCEICGKLREESQTRRC
jgi:hypothetical protein